MLIPVQLVLTDKKNLLKKIVFASGIADKVQV